MPVKNKGILIIIFGIYTHMCSKDDKLIQEKIFTKEF